MIREEARSAVVERLAERNARLVVTLQRTIAKYHRGANHAAQRWADCDDVVCLMAFRAIRRNED